MRRRRKSILSCAAKKVASRLSIEKKLEAMVAEAKQLAEYSVRMFKVIEEK